MLFFSSRKIFFSLINSFFFSIWTAKTSLRSVLTTIQISKKKELIAEKKKFLSEKKLRMRALPFQCNAFPATKKIYSWDLEKFCDTWKNFCIQRLEGTDLFSLFRENSKATPCYFSGTPRNSENQILSFINCKKWPESPQKHQKIQKNILLK